jgi:hypothetical protein
VGQRWESAVRGLFIERGHTVLPVYDVPLHTGKGPQLLTPGRSLVAPDNLVFLRSKGPSGTPIIWAEVKAKDGFAWYRKIRSWQTGIDARHFDHYVKVEEVTRHPVWMLFVQRGNPTKDQPLDKHQPTGVFVAKLSALRAHNQIQRHGAMVYWPIGALTLWAPLEAVERHLPRVDVAA